MSGHHHDVGVSLVDVMEERRDRRATQDGDDHGATDVRLESSGERGEPVVRRHRDALTRGRVERHRLLGRRVQGIVGVYQLEYGSCPAFQDHRRGKCPLGEGRSIQRDEDPRGHR